MSYIFYYPAKSGATTTVTLPDPERENKEKQIKVQAQGRTMSGTIRVYDKGVSRKEVDLEFQDLTDTQKIALADFFDDHADGMANAFQVDDHHGTTLNARFLETDLEWSEDNAETLPSTNPLWSVKFKLEIWA